MEITFRLQREPIKENKRRMCIKVICTRIDWFVPTVHNKKFTVPSNKSCNKFETACDDQAASDVPVANLTNFKSCSSLISLHKLIAGRVDITSLATTYMAHNLIVEKHERYCCALKIFLQAKYFLIVK